MESKTNKTILIIVGVVALTLLTKNALADTATGAVSITNAAPTLGSVTLYNQANADAAITLTAGSTVAITANVTITDTNGYEDISSANATLYHSTSTSPASDDENIHYSNTSCTLTGGSGNTINAVCGFPAMDFMALNGTWTVNISATDGTSAVVGTDTNTISSLAGLTVEEATLNFTSLALGANSTAASNITIDNLGNVQIDSRFSATNYSCTVGVIPVNNTKYNITTGSYDNLETDLTESAVTQTAFNLGVRGAATANGVNSTKNEFFGIIIPTTGVGGSCTNTLTVTAIAG